MDFNSGVMGAHGIFARDEYIMSKYVTNKKKVCFKYYKKNNGHLIFQVYWHKTR